MSAICPRLLPIMDEIYEIMMQSLFEFNDSATRKEVESAVGRMLSSVRNAPRENFRILVPADILLAIQNCGVEVPLVEATPDDTSISDFRVVCDATNNPTDNGDFILDVWIKPSAGDQFIQWKFSAFRSVDLDEEEE